MCLNTYNRTKTSLSYPIDIFVSDNPTKMWLTFSYRLRTTQLSLPFMSCPLASQRCFQVIAFAERVSKEACGNNTRANSGIKFNKSYSSACGGGVCRPCLTSTLLRILIQCQTVSFTSDLFCDIQQDSKQVPNIA